jgi:hypothetical protein
MSPLLVFVRFRSGVVGETRRIVHLVPLPQLVETTPGGTPAQPPDRLVALCRQTFAPGDAEQLNEPRGMPCEVCLLRSPAPEMGEVGPTAPAS